MVKAETERKGGHVIPAQPLTSKEFIRRLRELVDFVKDPESRYADPDRFAQSYARIIRLANMYPEKFETRYVIHNLGQKRIAYIRQLLEGDS